MQRNGVFRRNRRTVRQQKKKQLSQETKQRLAKRKSFWTDEMEELITQLKGLSLNQELKAERQDNGQLPMKRARREEEPRHGQGQQEPTTPMETDGVCVMDVPMIDVSIMDVTMVDVSIMDVTMVDVSIMDVTMVDVSQMDVSIMDVTMVDVSEMDVSIMDVTMMDVSEMDVSEMDIS
ncbi:hypothetical protein ABVT39_014045 [Epinephelus coioides]